MMESCRTNQHWSAAGRLIMFATLQNTFSWGCEFGSRWISDTDDCEWAHTQQLLHVTQLNHQMQRTNWMKKKNKLFTKLQCQSVARKWCHFPWSKALCVLFFQISHLKCSFILLPPPSTRAFVIEMNTMPLTRKSRRIEPFSFIFFILFICLLPFYYLFQSLLRCNPRGSWIMVFPLLMDHAIFLQVGLSRWGSNIAQLHHWLWRWIDCFQVDTPVECSRLNSLIFHVWTRTWYHTSCRWALIPLSYPSDLLQSLALSLSYTSDTAASRWKREAFMLCQQISW